MVAMIVSLFLTISFGYAEEASLPFPPEYAADQKEITFNSLWQEINQFQQLGSQQNYKYMLIGRKKEVEFLKNSFDRAQKLYDKKEMSLSEYSKRKVNYEAALLRAEELENDVAMMQDYAEIAKLGIIEQGDPDVDLRADIAKKMKDTLTHQRSAYQKGLAAAELEKRYHSGRLAAAKELYDNGNLSLDNYERVELDLQRATTDVNSKSAQIRVLDSAIHGLDRSLDRLFGEQKPKKKTAPKSSVRSS